MTTTELLQRLACGNAGCECAKSLQRGRGRTHCPAHDDRTPSLAVKEEAGATLWRCHGGCSQQAVTAAIGELRDRENSSPTRKASRARSRPREVAAYDYRDAGGELLYQSVRFEPKDFRQRKPKPDGSWDWSLNGVERVLYHLPDLASSPSSRWVFLVEGEKDADRLAGAGLLATTYAGGAKAPWQSGWTAALRGRRVAVLPDSDVPGLARAQRDAAAIAGAAQLVKVVPLPLEVSPDHGLDVSDWLDQGHDVDELKALVKAAPAYESDPDIEEKADAPARRAVVRRVGDLENLPTVQLSWLVERFLACGAISELTAFIKAGKSTVSAQLIASILHGDAFLGHFPAAKAPVVLLTEEPPVSLQPELEDAGIERNDELHILLYGENSTLSWSEAAGEAASLCREVGARVVVIDTLSMWAAVEDENDAGEARTAMKWLLHLASQDLAVLVLRHARKSGGEIHNAGRGSGAYGGAADILLHLDYTRDDKGRPQEESSRRELRIKSRLEREQPPPMKLDYQHGRYLLTERVQNAEERLEVLKRNVLTAGRQAAGPLTADELRRLVPSRKSDMLRVLRELTEAGQLARTERENAFQPYRYAVVPEQRELQGTTGTTDVVPEVPEPGNHAASPARARGVVPPRTTQRGREEPRRPTTPVESPPVVPSRSQAPGNHTAPDDQPAGSAWIPTCPTCGPRSAGYAPLGDNRRRCLTCRRVWTAIPPASSSQPTSHQEAST